MHLHLLKLFVLRYLLGLSLCFLVLFIIVRALSGLISNSVLGFLIGLVLLFGVREIRSAIAIQSTIIVAIGFAFLVGYGQFSIENAFSAFAENASIVGLICSVYVLRLLARPKQSVVTILRIRPTPANLLLVAHVLGSCLNLAVIRLVGDKFRGNKLLTNQQTSALLVGFANCSSWSPFFAALTLCVTAVPGSRYEYVAPFGFLFSSCFIYLMWNYIRKRESIDAPHDSLVSIDVSLAVWIAVLVVMTSIGLASFPNVGVVTIVTIAAVLTGVSFASLDALQGFGWSNVNALLTNDLPAALNEVALFSACGVLSLGVSAALTSWSVEFPSSDWQDLVALLVPFTILGLALIGLHPIAAVALVGPGLTPMFASSPDLLALMLSIGWCLGVIFSPFSGAQLHIVSSFGVDRGALIKTQLPLLPIAFISILVCFGGFRLANFAS